MSVDAYVGLPGSGKTYSVVAQQVLPALRANRHVVTNLPLKLDLIDAEIKHKGVCDLVDLQEIEAAPERLLEICTPGSVVILDEIWRLFPAGRKVDKIPEAYKSFFAEHRHRVDAAGNSTQIVIVTQDLAQISAFARQLIETTYRTTKLTTLGLSKRFRVDVYHGPVSGPNPPVNQALRQIFGKYEPKIYRYYNSHTQSESPTEGANEASVDARANILKRPLMLLAPFAIVACFAVSAAMIVHRKHQLEAAKTASLKTRDGFATLARTTGPIQGESKNAPTWHLTARLDGLCWQGGCGWALMERGPGESVWVPLHTCKAIGPNWSCANPAGDTAAPVAPPPKASGVTPAARLSPPTLAGSTSSHKKLAALTALGGNPPPTYATANPPGPQTR